MRRSTSATTTTTTSNPSAMPRSASSGTAYTITSSVSRYGSTDSTSSRATSGWTMRLELSQARRIREHDVGQRRAIDAAVGTEDVATERLDDPIEPGRARRDGAPRKVVRIDHDRASLGQHARRRSTSPSRSRPSGRPATCRGARLLGPGLPTRCDPRVASGPRGSLRARPRRAPRLRLGLGSGSASAAAARGLGLGCGFGLGCGLGRRLSCGLGLGDRFLDRRGRSSTGASTAGAGAASSDVSAEADTSASASMAASVADSASVCASAVASASATASRIACGTSSFAGAISGSPAGAAGAASFSTSISVPRGFSVTCRIDRLTRRRGTSTSITFTRTSSPTDSTDSGESTCSWLSSEMCTSPSIPGATRTNAPNGTSFVT